MSKTSCGLGCAKRAAKRPKRRSGGGSTSSSLVTKHGLAAMQSDKTGFDALHAYLLDRLLPVCTQLLDAAAEVGEIRPHVEAYELMRGVGNLCVGVSGDPCYDPRRMVELLIAGLRRP